MPNVYLGLGSNVGNRSGFLWQALKEIAQWGQTKASSLYETAPQGGPRAQPDYLNAVVVVNTEMGPFEVLDHAQTLEWRALRSRSVRHGPRTLDIDILLVDNCHIQSERLMVPHPRMLSRRFVIDPLLEVCPAVAFYGRLGLSSWREACRVQRVRRIPGTEGGQWNWYR